jgi:hypothetical protein
VPERLSIRRINATPLDIKAGHWRQDTPEIARYPASIYSTPWIIRKASGVATLVTDPFAALRIKMKFSILNSSR